MVLVRAHLLLLLGRGEPRLLLHRLLRVVLVRDAVLRGALLARVGVLAGSGLRGVAGRGLAVGHVGHGSGHGSRVAELREAGSTLGLGTLTRVRIGEGEREGGGRKKEQTLASG